MVVRVIIKLLKLQKKKDIYNKFNYVDYYQAHKIKNLQTLLLTIS